MKSKTNKKAGESLAFAAAILLAVSVANAETWWEGDAPDGDGRTYWEDSGNWWNGFSLPAHFVRRNFTEGKSRVVCFRSANEFAGYLVFGNDHADESGEAGPVVFRADGAAAGFKSTNENIFIGAGDHEGSIKVESGTYNANEWVVGQGYAGSLEVVGGTLIGRNQIFVGVNDGSVGNLTISDGGVVMCGEGTAEKYVQLSQNAGSTGTININDGGTLVTAHIQPGTGTPVVNFNGGTLRVNYGGTIFGSRANFTNYVNAAGGTLDTAGFETYVKALVKGEGTLRITGGGTVRLDNSGVKPECPIYVDEGVVFLTSAMTPASIRLGKNGFIRYDLVSITDTSAEDQTLAEGVTITMDEGETLAEHVLIRNNGSLKWQAYLDGTTLKAKNMTSETVTTTIWTDYGNNHWCDNAQNWTAGKPSTGVKTIIPFATRITQGTANLDCGDIVLKTSGQLQIDSDSNNSSLYHFAAGTISGDGSLYMSLNYFETTGSYDSYINLPLRLFANSRNTFIQGVSGHTIYINAPLTIDTQAKGCTVQGGVAINGDLTVTANSTLTFSGTQTLKGVIEGAGTIAGSFTTGVGAKIRSSAVEEGGVRSATCLTVSGTADLSNAEIEIVDEDGVLGRAERGDAIVVFRAAEIRNWSARTVSVGGRPWRVKSGFVTEGSETFHALVAVKSARSFAVFVR